MNRALLVHARHWERRDVEHRVEAGVHPTGTPTMRGLSRISPWIPIHFDRRSASNSNTRGPPFPHSRMPHRSLIPTALLLIFAGLLRIAAANPAPRFESEIQAFMEADRKSPRQPGGILFVGSSIFREWTHVPTAMAPLPVLNRAFGGSKTHEQLDRFDQVVTPHGPRVVVYYCGSNDLKAGEDPQAIFGRFKAFSERLEQEFPHCFLIAVSSTRSPDRVPIWERVDQYNGLVRAHCAATPRHAFVDINPALVDAEGKPRLDLYRDDKLHLHPPAYEAFTKILRPVLENVWSEAKSGVRPQDPDVVSGVGTAPGALLDIERQVTHGFATNNGVRIHYATMGKGPLVVMIHGFPDCWLSWRHQMPALARTHEVVAIDQRGYNLSDQPVGAESYDMARLVEDVEAVIRSRGRDRAVVVGHDWGGAVGWSFAMARPAMTAGLVVVNLPHPRWLRRELARNPQQQRNSAYARSFQQPGSHRALTPEGLASWVKDPEERARYVEVFRRSSTEAMMACYQRNYPHEPYTEDTSAPTPVNCPVLVFHGLSDPYLLAAGLDRTWELVSQPLTLITVPGASHWAHHDAAERVTRAMVDWLKP